MSHLIVKYLSIVWWLCTSYSFIDASTEGYEEEEVYGEEEENFDHFSNQGKLYWCKLLPMQANIAVLVQASKDTLASYFI